MEEVDLEKGEEEEVDEEMQKALAAFKRETEAMSKAIDKIHENIETIESRYKVSVTQDANSGDKAVASNDIARLLEQTERTSEAVRKRLRRIAGENTEFAKEHAGKTGELRIRVNTHQGLTRRFMEAMQMFEESQERHRDNVKSALERQLRKMNPDASDDDIQEAVRRGETDALVDNSETLQMMDAEEQTKLRNGLADLQSRNNDIKKLEESIIQLHQLFMDMQILVETQGELLNEIEYNIEDTKGKTEAGLQELVQARAHQKSATKKKICIIVLILAVIAAILIPILIKYIPLWFPGTKDVVDAITGGGQSNATQTSPSPKPTPAGSAIATRILEWGRERGRLPVDGEVVAWEVLEKRGL